MKNDVLLWSNCDPDAVNNSYVYREESLFQCYCYYPSSLFVFAAAFAQFSIIVMRSNCILCVLFSAFMSLSTFSGQMRKYIDKSSAPTEHKPKATTKCLYIFHFQWHSSLIEFMCEKRNETDNTMYEPKTTQHKSSDTQRTTQTYTDKWNGSKRNDCKQPRESWHFNGTIHASTKSVIVWVL